MNLLTMSNVLAWSLQAAAVIAAALLTIALLRVDLPAVRYLLLRVALAVCLLLAFVQPLVRPAAPSTPAAEAALGLPDPVAAGTATEARGRLATVGAWWLARWGGLVAVVIGAGAAARILWIVIGIARLRKLRRLGEIVSGLVEHDELQRLIGTSATIRYVRGLGQPVTFGVRRPVVLLPASLEDHPSSIHRAVLAHELWHVRRRDWMQTLIEETIRAIFWFHPGIWALVSDIQQAREEVVDELAILATGSRRSYVNALLAYADQPAPLAATGFARRKNLVHRVSVISKEAVMSPRRVVLSGAVVAAVLGSAGWYSMQALPLTQAGAAVADGQSGWGGPGPVEQRAKPISPENPVPRRTYFVPVDYPPEAESIALRGLVAVRVTLDESGAIAETRLSALSLHLEDGARLSLTNVSGSTLDNVRMTASGRSVSGVSEQQLRAALQKTVAAALRAVQHWQYAAPADGPIAFTVSVPVGLPAASTVPPPPPPAPPAPSGWQPAAGAVRVGGNIKAPTKLRNVSPIYPADAFAARVQGVVILEARIEPDGTVSEARVLRSIPLLDDAAVEAVRQWVFTPTLLNGEPVPVIMTVTVNFTLQ